MRGGYVYGFVSPFPLGKIGCKGNPGKIWLKQINKMKMIQGFNCDLGCGRPKLINNGRIEAFAERLFKFDTKVKYICNEGFTTDDSVETICQPSTFKWTLDRKLPNCRSMPQKNSV